MHHSFIGLNLSVLVKTSFISFPLSINTLQIADKIQNNAGTLGMWMQLAKYLRTLKQSELEKEDKPWVYSRLITASQGPLRAVNRPVSHAVVMPYTHQFNHSGILSCT